MPLLSLLRVIKLLSCTVTLFTGLILVPRSMVVDANRAPSNKPASPVIVDRASRVRGVLHDDYGHIGVFAGLTYPGTPAFMKYLVNETIYDDNREPWSKRYAPLHPHVVRTACDVVFNRSRDDTSPSKVIYGDLSTPKYKSLIVFIPRYMDISYMDDTLELVQGVMLSVMLSGVFDKNAEVTIVTSIPRLDAKGVPLNTVPNRTFNIETACKSLADDNINKNIIKFIMREGSEKWGDLSPSNRLENDEVPPLTMVQAWYQMAILSSPNSELEFPPNVFTMVRDYYEEFEDKLQGLAKVKHIEHETRSLYGISEDSVLLIFGSNDAYAQFLSVGEIGIANQPGIEHYERKKLDPQIGISDMKFSLPHSGDLYVENPVFCPRLYVSDSNNQATMTNSNNTGNIAPIFNDPYRQFISGPNYIRISTPAIVKICDKYAKLDDGNFNDGVSGCRMHVNSFGDFGATKCNGSTAANQQLAGLLSMRPPRKIIQIQLAPDMDSMAYYGVSNVDSLSILQTMMGCPDLLPLINWNEYNSSPAFNKWDENPDKGMLSACTPPDRGTDNNEALLLRSYSFAQAYNKAENMKNNNSNLKPPKGCTNSVLTLYASANDRSLFYYPKMSDYFSVLISMHLNDLCVGSDGNRFIITENDSLWRRNCVYYPVIAMFNCVDSGSIRKFTMDHTGVLLSIQNGLYAWHNPVDCRKFRKANNNKNKYFPRMECMLNNKLLIRKHDSVGPNRFVTSNTDSEVLYD